jgi:hypothetical protein
VRRHKTSLIQAVTGQTGIIIAVLTELAMIVVLSATDLLFAVIAELARSGIVHRFLAVDIDIALCRAEMVRVDVCYV